MATKSDMCAKMRVLIIVLKFCCFLAVGADLPLSNSMAINCLKRKLFKFGFVEARFSFCFLHFSSSNAGTAAD